NFARVGRKGDDVGQVRLVERILPVQFARLRVGPDPIRADDLAQAVRNVHRVAAAPDGAPARACTNASRRLLPSLSRSIDVAYEIRMKPGASNASPGVTATRLSSSSASAKSIVVRRPSGESAWLTSTNR